jgi:hypothetical protein
MALTGQRETIGAASGTVIALWNRTADDERSLLEDETPRYDAGQTDARRDTDRGHGDTRPMRSLSAGAVEDSSSARFQPSRRSNPPDGIPPVEGLRMRQVFEHEPVMEAEVVALFAPVPPGVVIDATVGGGGHASAILDAHPHLRVLGLDRDPEAVAAAEEKLARFGPRATVGHAPFNA